MNVNRESHGGAGVLQTAAIVFGGNNPPVGTTPTSAEEYDGTNWTSIASLSTGRPNVRGGTGTSDNAIVAGPPTATEQWNGSSWTAVPATLATGRGSHQMSGTYVSALLFGGSPYSTASEEYSEGTTTKTVTTST